MDGFGPENINLDMPEDNMIYAVGVNYWDDHMYGPSTATVRFYIYGQLVTEISDVQLYDHNMWWVASLSWPSGDVSQKLTPQGGLWITDDYHHTQFYQP